MIRAFDQRGLLPPGDHEATFDELRRSVLVVGPSDPAIPGWDAPWRKHLNLTDQAEILVRQLWQVGVTEFFLDGSFVEDKPHPNDIDGYFTASGRGTRPRAGRIGAAISGCVPPSSRDRRGERDREGGAKSIAVTDR